MTESRRRLWIIVWVVGACFDGAILAAWMGGSHALLAPALVVMVALAFTNPWR